MVSTLLAGRRPWCESSDDDEATAGWQAVLAPKSPVAEAGIADISRTYSLGPRHTPASTPVVGKGQFEVPPLCDYPTVSRTWTRTRPNR